MNNKLDTEFLKDFENEALKQLSGRKLFEPTPLCLALQANPKAFKEFLGCFAKDDN